MQARKCDLCGKRCGAITCYRTAFSRMGMPQMNYAHEGCFRWARRLKREAEDKGRRWLNVRNSEPAR